jgi:catechol 2,3-dioxygenase-like lactoylglutathione lyase family enzyme
VTDIHITGMDHIVLNVNDIDRALAFYTGPLGLAPERVDAFKRGEVGFPSVRIDATTLIDLTPSEPIAAGSKNLNHYCLVTDRDDLAEMAAELTAQGVPVVTGPVSRWGAQGQAMSIYVLDPDGNEIEIRAYPRA